MKSLLRALRFLKPYWLLAVGTFVALLIVTALGLVMPRLTQMIIDRGIAQRNINLVLWLTLAMVGFALLRALFEFLQGALAARTARGIAYDMRNTLYSKIQSLSFSYHDEAQTGQLLTRSTSDVEMARVLVGIAAIQLISAFLMIGGALALLFSTDWQLAFIILVIAPLTFVLFAWLAVKGRPIFTEVQQRLPTSTPYCRRTWPACAWSRPSCASPTKRSATATPAATCTPSTCRWDGWWPRRCRRFSLWPTWGCWPSTGWAAIRSSAGG